MILELDLHPVSLRAQEIFAWQLFGLCVVWQVFDSSVAGLLALYCHTHPFVSQQRVNPTVTLDLTAVNGGWMSARQVMVKDDYGQRLWVYRDEVSAEQFAQLRRAIKRQPV